MRQQYGYRKWNKLTFSTTNVFIWKWLTAHLPISKLEYRMVLQRDHYCFSFHVYIRPNRSINPTDLVTSHKFNKDAAIVTDIRN